MPTVNTRNSKSRLSNVGPHRCVAWTFFDDVYKYKQSFFADDEQRLVDEWSAYVVIIEYTVSYTLYRQRPTCPYRAKTLDFESYSELSHSRIEASIVAQLVLFCSCRKCTILVNVGLSRNYSNPQLLTFLNQRSRVKCRFHLILLNRYGGNKISVQKAYVRYRNELYSNCLQGKFKDELEAFDPSQRRFHLSLS